MLARVCHSAGAVQPAARALPAEARGREGLRPVEAHHVGGSLPGGRRPLHQDRRGARLAHHRAPVRHRSRHAAVPGHQQAMAGAGLHGHVRRGQPVLGGLVLHQPAPVRRRDAVHRLGRQQYELHPYLVPPGAQPRLLRLAHRQARPGARRQGYLRGSALHLHGQQGRPVAAHPPRFRHGAGVGVHQRDHSLGQVRRRLRALLHQRPVLHRRGGHRVPAARVNDQRRRQRGAVPRLGRGARPADLLVR